jgi:bifunctional DNA-binding transcriptional regulator/antitoxin component of YhaV-PrlF toxin-antitoxin module
MEARVKKRRRGHTRVSAKHQVTLPVDALERAGIRTGDVLRAEAHGPGEVMLIREIDPVERFAGSLTGAYDRDEVDAMRDEWD